MTFVPRLLLAALALLPLGAIAAPAPLVEGTDYVEIASPAPYAPLAGKIEVAEVFGYTCSHCAHFEPQLAAWAAKLPKDVRFSPVPAAFGGPWDSYARGYYAAEQLGIAKRSHQAVFDAIHVNRTLPGQGVSPQQLADFYANHGVTAERFLDALRGDAVEEKLKAARAFAARSGIQGTPSIIVNGKYLVRGNSFDDMLRITDALIARERAAARRR